MVEMKQACEYVRGLRSKLVIMGVLVWDPTYAYGDNKSGLANTTIPESTLKKYSNAITFHFLWEGRARDE